MLYKWVDIRANFVIFEDESVLVINKPVGISVVGDSKAMDLISLAKEAGEDIFPAHRIDKETSGLILFAKNQQIYSILARQFNKRTIEKAYLVITRSLDVPELGVVDLPLTQGRKDRVRVAAQRSDIIYDKEKHTWYVPDAKGLVKSKIYPSVTTFVKIWQNNFYTLLLVKPITGRRHQIRVHLAWIGFPIEGDLLFIKERLPGIDRTFLHSWHLEYNAEWLDNERIILEAIPGDDFWVPVKNLIRSNSFLNIASENLEKIKNL